MNDDSDQDKKETNKVALLKKSARAKPDPRFNLPQPSPWKRLALVLFLIFLFWAALKLRTALVLSKKPQIIHASRYSKEFKFRPAASPILTETLKDGRIRLRGALQEPTLAPVPSSPAKKKKKAGGSGKRKHGKSKVKPANK